MSDLPDGLILSETITGEGPEIFQGACEMGLESVVSKRPWIRIGPDVPSTGTSGRIKAVTKSRNTLTLAMLILAMSFAWFFK